MMQLQTFAYGFAGEPPKPPFIAASQPAEESDTVSEKRRIVVVDDERTIAETLVEILNGEGFEAVPAADGDAALELARALNPHIVISDVVLPGLSGVEVGIRIRELLPKCRIILFSGQAATVDLLKQARDRGYSFEILAKPIKPEDLLTILRDPGPPTAH